MLIIELLKQLEDLKSTHELEIEKLKKKIKWYSENQELLDQDLKILTNQRNDIKELRELIERLEKENERLKRNESTRKSDTNLVTDLKRQVRVFTSLKNIFLV